MWYFVSKCQKIGALVKVNRKRLKADLALRVRMLDPSSLVSKLGEFLLFDNFFDFSPLDFPNLNNFWDLADFWLSDLLVFGSIHFDLLLNLLPPPTSLILLAASTLMPSTLLAASTCDNMVVFSINVNGATILLNPWMNC